jgi:hypothetical protein
MTAEHEPGAGPELTPDDRERIHRRVDQALTEGVETFIAEHERLHRPFTAAELAEAVGIERFGERDAHLLLVALMGQGRVHHDHAGWHQGPSPPL